MTRDSHFVYLSLIHILHEHGMCILYNFFTILSTGVCNLMNKSARESHIKKGWELDVYKRQFPIIRIASQGHALIIAEQFAV